jgi:hypothetical protein
MRRTAASRRTLASSRRLCGPLDIVHKSLGVMRRQARPIPRLSLWQPAAGGGCTPTAQSPKYRALCLAVAPISPSFPRGKDQGPSSPVRR